MAKEVGIDTVEVASNGIATPIPQVNANRSRALASPIEPELHPLAA